MSMKTAFTICALVAASLALGSDVAHASASAASTAPTKIKIPKPVKKKKVIGTFKKKPASPSQTVTVGGNAVDDYKASKSLLTNPTAEVTAALDSLEGAGEINRSANAIVGVPVDAGLSPMRSLVIALARNELGKIDPNPNPPRTEPWSLGKHVKVGAVRLAEYNAVAYGSNAGQWANPVELTALVSAGKKHTTWCGIFALWAVKMGAGVTASPYREGWEALGQKFGSIAPLITFLGTLFTPEPDGFMPDKAKYQKVQWAPGGMYLYLAEDLDPFKAGSEESKAKLTPTAIVSWLTNQKTVPPIRPGDIGYTRERNQSGGTTNHHYIIERVMEVDGKYIYFTIEGNYWSYHTKRDQSVVRNYRVYDPHYNPATSHGGRHVIESFYDIDTLANLQDNRHIVPTN